MRTILGPRLYTRATGTPITESVTLEGYAPDATLRIASGDGDGRHRVTSGTVLVDGQEVVRPSDFNKQVATINVPITLGNTSVISVRLAGAPRDQFTLSVDGHLATSAALPSGGGTVHLLGDQVTLEVPAGAASGPLTITSDPAPAPSPEAAPGTIIDMGPSGTVFSSPVTLAIAFDPSALPAGARAGSLRMHWWNADHWEVLPGNHVDLQHGIVSAQTTHFSTFALLPNEVEFCPSDPTSESDLRTAITHIPDDGTVFVCDGLYLVDQVLIDRPMTLRGEHFGMATLGESGPGTGGFGNFNSGAPVLRVDGVGAGLVRIANIGITLKDQGIRPEGSFDKIALDSIRFTGTTGILGAAVRINGTTVAGARVEITNSDFRQLYIGIWPVSSVETNVRRSRFDGFGAGAVTYSNGQTVATQSFGRTEDNYFTNCSPFGCIRVLTTGAVVVARNVLEAGVQQVTQGAITVVGTLANPSASPTIIEDNTIVSYRTVQSASTPGGWMFASGISLSDANGITRTHVVRRNHVSDAYSALTTSTNTDASDNWFTGGAYAFRQLLARTVSFQRNDVVGALGSFTVPATGGNYRCNWWGVSAGPTAPPANVASSMYMPWATGPIAGTTVACP